MAADDGWTTVTTPIGRASASFAGWSGRPQLSMIDLALMLWRTKWVIVLIALPILVGSIFLALTMPVKYQATSRVQVTAGTERAFDPIVGKLPGTVLGQDEISSSEVELMHSPVIMDRVLQKLGLEVVYPKMAEAMAKAPPEARPMLYERAIAAMQKDFGAGAAPKNPVIRTGYQNADPVVAADVLNTIIETYLDYRSDLFNADNDSVLLEQRNRSIKELGMADDAIQLFLITHKIGDFNSEKTSIASIYGGVTDELFKVQAQKSGVDGRLAAMNMQLALTEPTIDLSVETNFEQQLLDLRIEREKLLSTFKPETPQVQAVDRRIANVEALVARGGGSVGGVIRRGPNDVYQKLDTTRAELAAESAALKTRFEELQRQKTQLEKRQLELTRIEPEYQDLLRDRAILDSQVSAIMTREGEERLKREVSHSDLQNVQVLEPARTPTKGKSMRKLVVAAGFLFGGFTGLVCALILIFTKSTLPTATCASRTTGLPVLASVRPMR